MSATKVNVKNFARAETDLMFSRLAAGVGVGTWNHTRGLKSLDDQPIIRQNRDTLYSSIILDVREGVTLTLPDTGERYISADVVNQDHYGALLLREPGEHVLTREVVGSDYAAILVRILVDPTDDDDVAAVNRLQDGLVLAGGGSGEFPLPEYDEASQVETREALLVLGRGVSTYDRAFGSRAEVDPVMHLLGAAGGWGRSSRVRGHLHQRRRRLARRGLPPQAQGCPGGRVLVGVVVQRCRLLRDQRPRGEQHQQPHCRPGR